MAVSFLMTCPVTSSAVSPRAWRGRSRSSTSRGQMTRRATRWSSDVFGSLFRKSRPGLEQQLQDLVQAGVRGLPEATPEGLLGEWSQKQFEESPYLLALVALGGDDPPLSENIWHFDTECIEDHGAYVRID